MRSGIIDLIKKEIIVIKYTIIGVLFGISFPVCAVIFDLKFRQFEFTIKNILSVYSVNPLNFIILSAPFFLGVLSMIAGRSKQKSERSNKILETTLTELFEKENINELLIRKLNVKEKSQNDLIKKLLTSNKKFSETSKKSNVILNEIRSQENDLDLTFEIMKRNLKDFKIYITSFIETNKTEIKKMKNVHGICNESYKLSSENIEKVEKIKDSILKKINEINSLGDTILSCNDAVLDIGDISMKIQILSLNASIEAYNSKSSYSGFEMIAKEIKAMSAQTQITVELISKLMNDLVRQMDSIQKSLTETSEGAFELTEIYKRADESFNEIATLSEKLITSYSLIDEDSHNIEGIIEKTVNDMLDAIKKIGIQKSIMKKSKTINETNIKVLNELEQSIDIV